MDLNDELVAYPPYKDAGHIIDTDPNSEESLPFSRIRSSVASALVYLNYMQGRYTNKCGAFHLSFIHLLHFRSRYNRGVTAAPPTIFRFDSQVTLL